MKKTLAASTTLFAICLIAIAQISAAGLAPTQQEEAPGKAPVAAQSSSPSDTVVEPESVLDAPVVTEPGTVVAPLVNDACCDPCNTCCCTPCCCPVPTTLCLIDDCGCSYEVCVHLPPCCVGEAPLVSWRDGILGRKIAQLCWPCCKKRAKVVIPIIGEPRVWE